MVHYVYCECGNMIVVSERHDFSVLPCPACVRAKEQNFKTFTLEKSSKRVKVIKSKAKSTKK